MNQMKLIKTIAAAAVIGTSLIAATPAEAGCYPALAAGIMVPIIRETGDVQMATQAAQDEGVLDVTESCTYRTVSIIKRFAHVIY